jgi:Mrp family chromosome partitioning ATPase
VAYLNPGIALDNPAEYLDSPGFGLLLEALKHQYHWILIDAPPLLGGVETADTYALLSLSDGAVVLTEHDATEEQAHLAGRKLQQASVPIVGSVVRLSSDVSD